MQTQETQSISDKKVANKLQSVSTSIVKHTGKSLLNLIGFAQIKTIYQQLHRVFVKTAQDTQIMNSAWFEQTFTNNFSSHDDLKQTLLANQNHFKQIFKVIIALTLLLNVVFMIQWINAFKQAQPLQHLSLVALMFYFAYHIFIGLYLKLHEYRIHVLDVMKTLIIDQILVADTQLAQYQTFKHWLAIHAFKWFNIKHKHL